MAAASLGFRSLHALVPLGPYVLPSREWIEGEPPLIAWLEAGARSPAHSAPGLSGSGWRGSRLSPGGRQGLAHSLTAPQAFQSTQGRERVEGEQPLIASLEAVARSLAHSAPGLSDDSGPGAGRGGAASDRLVGGRDSLTRLQRSRPFSRLRAGSG